MGLSPLMDENMLAATGAEATRGICSGVGFFDCMVTVANLDFRSTYERRFGRSPPALNSQGESCYEGVKLLSALVEAAGRLDVRRSRRPPITSSPGRPEASWRSGTVTSSNRST